MSGFISLKKTGNDCGYNHATPGAVMTSCSQDNAWVHNEDDDDNDDDDDWCVDTKMTLMPIHLLLF